MHWIRGCVKSGSSVSTSHSMHWILGRLPRWFSFTHVEELPIQCFKLVLLVFIALIFWNDSLFLRCCLSFFYSSRIYTWVWINLAYKKGRNHFYFKWKCFAKNIYSTEWITSLWLFVYGLGRAFLALEERIFMKRKNLLPWFPSKNASGF